jgi:hypothetical protein
VLGYVGEGESVVHVTHLLGLHIYAGSFETRPMGRMAGGFLQGTDLLGKKKKKERKKREKLSGGFSDSLSSQPSWILPRFSF